MAGAVAYAYKGRDGAGKVVKGKVDASSEGAVITRLRTMGVQPISISEAGAGTGLQREVSIPGLGDRAVR